MISSFEMLRSNINHIGSAPIKTPQTQLNEDNKQNTVSSSKSSNFENYLVDAMSYVNQKQQASDSIAQQLIVDPDSVDIHDVTISMAEANLSLSMAQSVIDRLIKGWNEITTTR